MTFFRMILLFFLAAAAHWWFASYLSFFGCSPQILLILTIVGAAKEGPNAAMFLGFFWGLFLDFFGAHLFGANALILTLVGYAVGAVRRQIDVNGFGPLCVIVLNLSWAYFLFSGILGLVFLKFFYWAGWKPFLLDPLYNCALLPFGVWAWNAALGGVAR